MPPRPRPPAAAERTAHERSPRQKPRSTTGRSSGLRLSSRNAGRSSSRAGRGGSRRWCGGSCRCGPRPAGQPHVLEARRVQPLLLARQVREVLGRDRRHTRVVALPHLRAGRRGPVVVLGEPGQRPDLHERLLRAERPEAVGRRAAVHRQHEEVREGVDHRLGHPGGLDLVEVGHHRAGVTVPAGHRLVQGPLPLRSGRAAASAGRSRSLMRSATATSVAWTMPAMPSFMVRR